MEDKKFLRVTVSPHIHSPVTTQRLMLDVIIALVPALLFAIWLYGLSALLVTAVSVIACVFFEWISRKIMKRDQTIQDLSAVVTGILLAFCLPANLPLYMVVVGDFIAIVVAKQFFGGIGMNFVNPALIGRIALSVSFAKEVASVPQLSSSAWKVAQSFGATDAASSASPMQIMKGLITAGHIEELPKAGLADWRASLLGLHTGSIGEVSVLCLLLGLIYLLVRGVIQLTIPASYIGSVFVFTLAYTGGDFRYTIMTLLSGGLFLGAIFMATDYTTCPTTPKGKLIFGIGCGLLTSTIRYFGGMPEAVAYSIVLMNILVPYINQWTKPVPFGGVKKKKLGFKKKEAEPAK